MESCFHNCFAITIKGRTQTLLSRPTHIKSRKQRNLQNAATNNHPMYGIYEYYLSQCIEYTVLRGECIYMIREIPSHEQHRYLTSNIGCCTSGC
jgi:hypothetical protein